MMRFAFCSTTAIEERHAMSPPRARFSSAVTVPDDTAVPLVVGNGTGSFMILYCRSLHTLYLGIEVHILLCSYEGLYTASGMPLVVSTNRLHILICVLPPEEGGRDWLGTFSLSHYNISARDEHYFLLLL